MNPIRFISSYTEGTIYKDIMDNYLRPSLEKFNLPHHIFSVKDLGHWAVNSRQRPLYIKQAMEMFPGENIVWIDADARILKNPDVLFHIPLSCHLGANYLLWEDHYGRITDKDKVEILDGTSYFQNSPEMLKFMDEWIERSVYDGVNHRRVLGEMIDERIDDNLTMFIIPRSYCYVLTTPDGSEPVNPLKDPTIIHYNVSTKARKNLYDS